MVVFHKLEKILEKIQDEKTGVPIRTVKTFMTKIPSVFTGTDLITWLMTNMEFSEINEALNLANRMTSFGYFFPIDDHVMTVKNDNTYYRFQVQLNPDNCTVKICVKPVNCVIFVITNFLSTRNFSSSGSTCLSLFSCDIRSVHRYPY